MSIVIHPERSHAAGISLKDEETPRISSFWFEFKHLVDLAVPTVIIHLSFVVPPFLTASYVGRNFGYIHLDGYTLANLTGNLLTLALLQGLYNACDTLSPQAFGANNYREVGLLAMRGFAATMMVIVPINIVLYLFMDRILVFLGQDEEAAEYAWQFYLIYASSFPFYSLYNIVWKFLSSQDILMPLVVCTLVSALVVLPVCLEVFTRVFGFLGAGLAITVFYVVESLSVVAWVWWLKPHHPETWPGFSAWNEAIAWEPFKAYVVLGVGGMLASLEWVYWEALALVIGTLGVLPLSAHTVPTQVVFIMFMFPLGVGIALAIRLGATISRNVQRAKNLALGTFLFSLAIFSMFALLLYVFREAIFRIFTDEPAVIALCHEIWFNVCLYFVVLGAFGVNIGISIGLGMQWTLGIMTVISLWLLGMPASYYFAVVRGGGLNAAWMCIWPPYLLIDVCMMTAFLTTDWDEISAFVRIREGLESRGGGAMESLTLVENDEDHQETDYGSTTSNR